jgi:hypothetical protein
MKWIVKILDIEPYTLTCLWNDNEIRTIDLTSFLKEKARNQENSYYQLKDKRRFSQAKCDGTTIYWENGIKMRDYDGIEKSGPLDIDPEILFEMSYRMAEKTTKGSF